MTSRRRQQPAAISEDPGERTGDSDRETPKKSGRKLSRSTRAAPLPGQTAPPRSDREEEPCSNKKTPKRFSRSKPWTSTINSPSNDPDQQQDIFWDPHSPTTFKLENGKNGKKKLAANKCTVDISDIVNRIAPKNEKPSSSDTAYLGVWIGEDAIPCTPVVARARAKMPRSRILHTEELMKLAKQLDSNLVKQKDQNKEHLNSEDQMFSECNALNNEGDSFLEDLPEGNDIAHVLKSVSQTSAPQRCSQRSVDQDAEAAFNALFDSSTQKYSGHLSQSLSDVSISSGNEAPQNVRRNNHEAIGYSKKEQSSEKPKKLEQSSLASVISADTLQGVGKCSEQNTGKEKETVQSLPSSQDDFEDDWDNDLLEDDSFIMQVTQNPELIATPKNCVPHDKPGQTNAHPGMEVKSTDISSSSKTNSYKFVPRKVNGGSEAKPSNLCSSGMTTVSTFQGSSRRTNNVKTISSIQTHLPSKPQTKVEGEMSKNNVLNLVTATTSTLMKSFHKPCAQAVPQTRAMAVNKDSVLHDEWDDPKFSDEVLDMFCESDSLWEGKEDDDDLLYQVCDDVERLTQAQEISEEKPKELPSLSCQMLAKPGPNARHGSLAANSSFNYNKLNNRGVSPASFSGNCSNVHQNENQTFSRSSFVPSGGGDENTILTSTRSQNPVKSPATTCSVTNTLGPSAYSFTRIKPSQAASVHTTQSAPGNWSSYNGLHHQSFGDSRNNRDTFVQSSPDSILKQSSLRRHLSESTIQSSKVLTAEDKNKKCSMEEIEKKKREALARRKMKARACSGDSAPT